MNDLLIIDMLPTYGLLFYLLISVFVFVGCRGLRRRTSDRGLLRFAVGAFLVVSALGAVFAALVYISQRLWRSRIWSTSTARTGQEL
ncbi:hypothetical protein LZF93_05415 [Bifidobacterium longum]|nr:hypothetical protein LZF93_05415 [Bifidobacterium longum]